MFSKRIFSVILFLFFSTTLWASISVNSLEKAGTDQYIDELTNQYERGVKLWEEGNGHAAFSALDSLRKINLTPENANIKSKAMIYLAKCFYSQKNYSSTLNYLTAAIAFGNDNLNVDARLAIYDMMITCYHETQNSSQELVYTQLKKAIEDSINTVKIQLQVDSLKKALAEQKKAQEIQKSSAMKEADANINSSFILYGIIGILVLIILVFAILRKSKSSNQPRKVEVAKIDNNGNKNSSSLIEKISKVELVFIRADVLGEYGNKKTVVKIINDYNTQLPLIIKNLDDAITTNDNEPIINALSYLKPYLTAFGMTATLAMLNEVEAESATEKTTKLLSRVFQIRNHIRRAHDETKALIEVLG
jgi:tetratricopeptide (TPR) repeat protein